MGSHVLIDDEFTLDVEECDDDDDEELEIIHEKHIRVETEPECNFENYTNFCFSSDIHIKQEIVDFEDNYIEDGEFIDLDKIKTEIDLDLEENDAGIDAEEEEISAGEEKAKEDNIGNEKTKEDSIENEQAKEESLEDSIEKEKTNEESLKEERREEGDTKEKEKEEDNIKVKEREDGNTKEDKMNENSLEGQPKVNITQEKHVPKKIPNTTLYKENVTKPQINRPPLNQKRKFSSSSNPKEPLDRRKPFNNRNKNKRHHPSQEHRKKEWNGRRRRLGGEYFYNNTKREPRYERFNNRPSIPNFRQNTPSDWQIYSTILGVLNQAFGQQMAQNRQIDDHSLVPYFPQSRTNHNERMKNNWFEQLKNRPKVWASDFENGAYAPHFQSSAQLQTYTNILQTFSQIRHGGFIQNNVNNIQFQMSFLNVFKG